MKEDVIRTIVFLVLITVIMFSMLGTWGVITIDMQEKGNPTKTLVPESEAGAGYVSLNIGGSENNQENE